jgi:predicted extracellular nuclease
MSFATRHVSIARQHFKSKGYGSKTAEKRKRQATRVAKIYNELIEEGETNVAVLGDLNDTPDSDALSPLLAETDLKDITENQNFTSDGRAGIYKNGAKGQKIDYLLLSPALDAKVTGGSIFRMGVCGGTKGTLFPHYATMTKAVEAASDHAAIYANIDLH